jgi:hypothetical protein
VGLAVRGRGVPRHAAYLVLALAPAAQGRLGHADVPCDRGLALALVDPLYGLHLLGCREGAQGSFARSGGLAAHAGEQLLLGLLAEPLLQAGDAAEATRGALQCQRRLGPVVVARPGTSRYPLGDRCPPCRQQR